MSDQQTDTELDKLLLPLCTCGNHPNHYDNGTLQCGFREAKAFLLAWRDRPTPSLALNSPKSALNVPAVATEAGLTEILEDYANFKVWESQHEWMPDYDRKANLANSRNRGITALLHREKGQMLEARIAELKRLMDWDNWDALSQSDKDAVTVQQIMERIAELEYEAGRLHP